MIATISQALQRGDTAAALSAAQAFAISDAQNPQAHHWLGICLHKSGDIAGARSAIDQAINMAPDRADFQISRATLALGQKDFDAVTQGMKNAINLDPNQLQAYVTLAHIALARSENEEATKQLKLAQRIDPEHPQVLLLEGHIAQYSGQGDLALNCFTAAAQASPKNPLTQVSLGMAYAARGMWPFAEQAFKNAMALESGNPGVMRGLVRSQMQQEKWPEAIDTLGQWLIKTPFDNSARMMRAQIRVQIGLREEAIEDLQMVNTASPGNPQVLSPLVNVLATLGRGAEATELLDQALKSNQQSNLIWSMRVAMSSHLLQETQELLQRWLAALPESPQAIEALAQLQETMGEFEAAEANADKALTFARNLPFAQFIKLRAEIRSNPKQALARLETLEKAATNPESERMVYAWRGLTHDRMGEFDRAAESFREMAKRALVQHPLPPIFPVRENSDADIKGTLLWAPVGTRLEVVLQALSGHLGSRLLADRNLPNSRMDGFGHQRGLPGSAEAGTADRWQDGVRRLGIEPENAVDWIPHLDGETLSALKGVRTIAVMCDPRDALLNWMVYGSAQAYRFHPNDALSAEWLAQTCESFVELLESNPDNISLVKVDGLPANAASVAAALQIAIGTDTAPDEKVLAIQIQARGGFENQFPSGHWRNYYESFKVAMDRLTPVAVRLGYSEN